MRPRRRVRRGFDEGWKYAIRAFLPECLLLLFPSLHAQIDWTRPVEFLSTELHRLAPAQLRKGVRSVDVLVRVYFRDGVPHVVLLHIEIQAQHDPNFSLRMFVYYYRIFDANDYPELISLAILADDDPNWRPSVFERRLAGCNLRFEFPTVKLLDFDEAELEQSENPFALVVLAHLRALKTRGRPNLMLREKLALIRAMHTRGYRLLSVHRQVYSSCFSASLQGGTLGRDGCHRPAETPTNRYPSPPDTSRCNFASNLARMYRSKYCASCRFQFNSVLR